MHLDGYLQRVGYHGARAVSRETLFALHRAHVRAIPYENLDIALGRPLLLEQRAIYDKLVTAQRGGWCYEMNGLLAWGLGELGFSVTLLSSRVGRKSFDTNDGIHHLLLLVELDHAYIADVGFGNGMLEPLPLRVGIYQQDFRTYHLAQQGERWLLTKDARHGYPGPGVDFTLRPHRINDFADHSTFLQTSPESHFVRTTICHRFTEHSIVSLVGIVLRTILAESATERVIESESDYTQTLAEQFGIRLPAAEVSLLWQRAWERHDAWLASRTPTNGAAGEASSEKHSAVPT